MGSKPMPDWLREFFETPAQQEKRLAEEKEQREFFNELLEKHRAKPPKPWQPD